MDLEKDGEMFAAERYLYAEGTVTGNSPVRCVQEVVLRPGDACHLKKRALLHFHLTEKAAGVAPDAHRVFATGVGDLEKNPLRVVGESRSKV